MALSNLINGQTIELTIIIEEMYINGIEQSIFIKE